MTEDKELKKIRVKKAQELLQIAEQRKKRMQELKDAEEAPRSVEEKDKLALMQFFLVPEAYEYWIQLYEGSDKKGLY